MLSEFTGGVSPGDGGEGGLYGEEEPEEADYTETLPGDESVVIVPDPIGDVDAFAAVATAEELQEALVRGTNHILITAHLDATDVEPVEDLEMREALNSAVGRVQNTTLSISVRCPPCQHHSQIGSTHAQWCNRAQVNHYTSGRGSRVISDTESACPSDHQIICSTATVH